MSLTTSATALAPVAKDPIIGTDAAISVMSFAFSLLSTLFAPFQNLRHPVSFLSGSYSLKLSELGKDATGLDAGVGVVASSNNFLPKSKAFPAAV